MVSWPSARTINEFNPATFRMDVIDEQIGAASGLSSE
jgi:hypothetical protein